MTHRTILHLSQNDSQSIFGRLDRFPFRCSIEYRRYLADGKDKYSGVYSRMDGIGPDFEVRDDAKIAASTSYSPEKLRGTTSLSF